MVIAFDSLSSSTRLSFPVCTLWCLEGRVVRKVYPLRRPRAVDIIVKLVTGLVNSCSGC
jgi:hypothetical protein